MANNNVDVNINVDVNGEESLDSVVKTTDKASDSVGALSEQFGLMDTQLGKAASGVVSFGKKGVNAMKTFKGAVISTGIGALVIAVVSLIQYFTKTERGANNLKKVMGGLNAVLGKATDFLVSIGEGLFNAIKSADSFGEGLKNLGNIIKNAVLTRLEAFSVAGKAIVKLLKGQWKEGFKELANASIQMTTGVKDGMDKIKQATEEVVEAYNAGAAVAERTYKLHIANRKAMVTEAEQMVALSEARQGVNDQLATEEERIESLNEAQKINNGLYDDRIARAKEAYEIKKAENALSESTTEDLDEEYQLKANLIALEAERNDRNKEYMDQRSSLLAAAKAEREADAQSEIEQAQTVNDELLALQQEHIENIAATQEEADIARIEYEQEVYEADLERRLANEEITQEQLAALKEAYAQKTADALANINNSIVANEKETAIKEVKIAAAEKQAKVDGAATAANALVSISQSVFGDSKAASIASTVIDTYSSATSAFNSLSGIPIVGPALGAVAAAAAVASGLANVNKIRQTSDESSTSSVESTVIASNPTFQGGGDIVGNLHGTGGVNINAEGGESVVNRVAMSSPAGDVVRAINSNQGGANFITAEAAAAMINTLEVVVTESAITDKQKEVSVRESAFTK